MSKVFHSLNVVGFPTSKPHLSPQVPHPLPVVVANIRTNYYRWMERGDHDFYAYVQPVVKSKPSGKFNRQVGSEF